MPLPPPTGAFPGGRETPAPGSPSTPLPEGMRIRCPHCHNPIQLSDGKDISLSGQSADRPEVIEPSAVYPAPTGGVAPYSFNPAAFMCAGSNATCTVSSGLFGNLGRNAIYGPGQINWDMAVSRRFSMRERWKLDARADFFNIMNHGNWNNPTTTVTSSTFGEVTSFMPPRIIQLALKLYF